MMKKLLIAGVAFTALAAPLTAQACATCGCSLSSDMASGFASGYGGATDGWLVSLMYNYINQDELRTGTHQISPGVISAINANGGSQEAERKTVNNYITAGVSYSPNAEWHFNLLVPYIDRYHATYGQTNEINTSQISTAQIDDLGDIKLITSYQGLLPNHSLGIQVGAKLPTGSFGGQTASGVIVGRNPVLFNSGPSSGSGLDTSLNAGNGSTDLIFGAYYHQAISQDFDAFANGQYEFSVYQLLDGNGANYRPGNSGNFSAGLRYEADPRWVPQLQLNLTRKSSDQGALADTTDTAGTVAYISPGITVRVIEGVHAFGIVQIPVASWLQGYQLFPRWTGSVGVSYAF